MSLKHEEMKLGFNYDLEIDYNKPAKVDFVAGIDFASPIPENAEQILDSMREALEVAIACIEDCEYASLKIGSNSRIDTAINDWYEYAQTHNVDGLLKERKND